MTNHIETWFMVSYRTIGTDKSSRTVQTYMNFKIRYIDLVLKDPCYATMLRYCTTPYTSSLSVLLVPRLTKLNPTASR